jgi:hypothetical protein
LEGLRDVGQAWSRSTANPSAWRPALPVDPAFGHYPMTSEFCLGLLTRFVPVAGTEGRSPPIRTTTADEAPPTAAGCFGQTLRRTLFGLPLDAGAIASEQMRKLVALPVPSADALSSVAYGPEAMLAVLVLAGSVGLSYSLPVGGAITREAGDVAHDRPCSCCPFSSSPRFVRSRWEPAHPTRTARPVGAGPELRPRVCGCGLRDPPGRGRHGADQCHAVGQWYGLGSLVDQPVATRASS